MYRQLIDQTARAMGSSGDEGPAIGMDMEGFLLDLPLLSLLHFQESLLSESPEAMVDGLLGSVQVKL